MRNFFLALLSISILVVFIFSCASTIYVPEAPPPAKEEIKSPRPGPKAVWVAGYWKWSGGQYVWIPGHWVKKPKGRWVTGHWERRPRGWVYVKGHWRP